MRNRKLLYVLMPLIIILLILIAGVIYLKLNSSPEKIFENTISKVFGKFEETQEHNSTVKGTMKITASVEAENEQLNIINTMLDNASVNLDMQADTANMVINENLNVIFNNESLLDVTILLQDQKGYLYLKDYLNKYLELPTENTEYGDLTEYYKKIATLDKNALIEAIEEELIAAISNQELVQENTTLLLNGTETKVTASIFSLKDAQINVFYSGLLNNLKQNEKFQIALGAYKNDVLAAIDGMTQEMGEAEDLEFVFTIYTKGFLNEFVGVSARSIDNSYYEGNAELEILKHNEGKYEFISYEGSREEGKITVEDKKESKNKGTSTITITVDQEQFIVTYGYEKQGKQNSFIASTEVEGVALSISGNAVEDGKNVKGNVVISVQEETFGKVNVNCAYDFIYDEEIQKVDTINSVLINELSEEDKTTLMTNLQKSKLYNFVEQNTDFNVANNKPEVTYGDYTVAYNIPDGFEESSYNSEDYKMYMDDNFNSIKVSIDWTEIDTYMKDLEDEYILTSDFYENQNLSDIRKYTVNGKEYKFRTLTYNDEYGTYVNLYFAYEINDEICYVVEVESEGGKISMDTIKNFLDVKLLKKSIQNAIVSEEDLGRGNVYMNGGETVNVNDIINIYN